jgi:hypothetical protein
MNGPAITAVVLAAVGLIVIGFVLTVLVLSNAPTNRWRNTTDAGDFS